MSQDKEWNHALVIVKILTQSADLKVLLKSTSFLYFSQNDDQN